MINSLGIILIATGEYKNFISNVIKSININNKKYNIHFYIFTDTTQNEKNDQVSYFYWASGKWPFPTLLRYHKICEIENNLLSNEFLIYLDVDMIVNSSLPELIKNNIFAVRHPGYSSITRAPFEKNTNSKAYIPKNMREVYVCGGVQGGDTTSYLKICKLIRSDIDFDLNNNYIPKWHDESYWNKYVNLSKNKQVFDRSYCWPEQWISNKNPGRIIALNKNHRKYREQIVFWRIMKLKISSLIMVLRKPRNY